MSILQFKDLWVVQDNHNTGASVRDKMNKRQKWIMKGHAKEWKLWPKGSEKQLGFLDLDRLPTANLKLLKVETFYFWPAAG